MTTELPVEIMWLVVHEHYNIPIGSSIYEKIKREHPRYWNKLGEFDPYFKKRNAFINFFRAYLLKRRQTKELKLWKKMLNQ